MTIDIDALWDFSDPAGTEQKFLDLQAELQTQLARTHSLRGQFSEAHALLSADDYLAKSEPERLARLGTLSVPHPPPGGGESRGTRRSGAIGGMS